LTFPEAGRRSPTRRPVHGGPDRRAVSRQRRVSGAVGGAPGEGQGTRTVPVRGGGS